MWLSPLLSDWGDNYNESRSRQWRRGFICGFFAAMIGMLFGIAVYSAIMGL
jgi:hypothetical protein